MSVVQLAILAPVPRAARYLRFRLREDAEPARSLLGLSADPERVIGIGPTTISRIGATIPGLREFPALAGVGIGVPSTPAALWCWLTGDDPGALFHQSRALISQVEADFEVEQVVDGFRHDIGRDLSGYEDGTENPKDDAAAEAALVSDAGVGLDGSSFVAVQQWVHNFGALDRMSSDERNTVIGRDRDSNEELASAPASAHVRRTAQESFTPPAFVLRRSMPWADATGAGLMFVAFGRSLDAYEAQLRRMVGLEDGITDGLYRFTRPITGSYLWCPPIHDGRLDLRALGL